MKSQIEAMGRGLTVASIVFNTNACVPIYASGRVEWNSPATQTVEHVLRVNTSGWFNNVIESGITLIPSTGKPLQCTDIGLRELYIVSDRHLPLVAIGAIGNSQLVQEAHYDMPFDGIGFQRILSPTLDVDIRRSLRASNISSLSQEELDGFIERSRRVINQLSDGALDGSFGLFTVIPRPSEEGRYALVFDQGLFTLTDGRISEQSCFERGFLFPDPPQIRGTIV